MNIAASPRSRARIRLRGVVQGVGFRPFVHSLAMRYQLGGFVLNDAEGVLAEVEGRAVEPFLRALEGEKPPLARIDGLDVTILTCDGQSGFAILESLPASGGGARVPPDAATCAACLDDLFNPLSRFHLYPFVTCTHCGPRFTILKSLPFDRRNTSMADFAMCADCARDYADPTSRRFHAQTIACAACGPKLSHSIEAIATALRDGRIVAVKGTGAFHLFCDAMNEAAVARLRRAKKRPAKPFAIMVRDLAAVDLLAAPTSAECDLLGHSARPIVLVRGAAALAPSVGPGMERVGIMLPATPPHHLLFHALERSPPTALVVTSANSAGQAPIIDNLEAIRALSDVADIIVTHDRPILSRADDSVMAVIDSAPAFIRRSRGFTPEPIDLGEDGPSVLAVGAHLKATLCVTRGREAFLSQHVGDLDAPDTIRFYLDTARRMLADLGSPPDAVVCDLHPNYRSTIFAETLGLPLLRAQHHAAHVAAVAAEHGLRGQILGVALDGHGYGADGGAWGGELIALEGARWTRMGHLAPLGLPGGDRAAREPWRMGVAALIAMGRGAEAAARFPDNALAGPLSAAREASPGMTTSSLGRLFDAAAALLGLCATQSYEGEAAMRLEALVRAPTPLPGGYTIARHVLDFRPLLAALLQPGLRARDGAELFHGTLIAGLAEWIGQAADELGLAEVALGGGCMINRVLAEGLASALRDRGLTPWLARAAPANDGGLALGQAAMARAYLTTEAACGSQGS